MPHLKRGALRDFQTIMDIGTGSHGWHGTDKIFTFPNGCRIEFFSADSAERLRGAGRDILFINECNNITHEMARQLMIRTRSSIFMDWNPQSKFWFHEYYQGKPKTWFNTSTHFDNHHLEESIRARIEETKYTDPEWYRVYGMGQIGRWEGKVFPRLRVADLGEIYKTIDRSDIRYGLDFGYYPDPCAFLVTARVRQTIYIFKEIVANEILNEDLATLIRPWSEDRAVWCDSASPDRITSLKKLGINARSVGSKDRNYSIAWLRHCDIVIDDACKQTFKELDNYSRKTDKSGEVLPVFQDGNDHCVDALRYSFKPDMKSDGEIKSLHLAI
jgi:phage terminase large subunit